MAKNFVTALEAAELLMKKQIERTVGAAKKRHERFLRLADKEEDQARKARLMATANKPLELTTASMKASGMKMAAIRKKFSKKKP